MITVNQSCEITKINTGLEILLQDLYFDGENHKFDINLNGFYKPEIKIINYTSIRGVNLGFLDIKSTSDTSLEINNLFIYKQIDNLDGLLFELEDVAKIKIENIWI